MRTVSILGIGRAGGALAIALKKAGIRIDQLVYRTEPISTPVAGARAVQFDELEAIDSDVLLIATRDPEIRRVAEDLSMLRRVPELCLHISGSLSSSELSPLKRKGSAVGSMHPLVSISESVAGAKRFSGAFFCVEGDGPAVEAANELVTALGGTAFSIESALKPLYHASAVMASGNVTAVFDVAIEMLSNCGVDRAEAQRILHPLLESAVANLSRQKPEDALTGPFVRGDTDALARHLASFDGTVRPDVRALYLLLAARSAEIAARSSGADLSGLMEAISMAKGKSGC